MAFTVRSTAIRQASYLRSIQQSLTRQFFSYGSTKSNLPDVGQRIENELIRLEPTEVVSGMRRDHLIERLRNDSDPYSIKALKHGPGTKDEPNMIPSAYDSRMVGCICEEDSDTIVWMWLHKGEPKRCQCGHYFQLFYEAPVEDLPPLL